ncbi:hypothetical protein ASG49_02575 [Marmoricola sp. Leaf446]|uniref:hypothetical protein n=1 Tax=Marmoricola sp. Leaf446 TaxID=1736379 RepID=UPI0006FBB1CB|nr:hypothetical protein [Marmoricola sp. Leaf446]KQT93867.1 hypothetical protein ASG49_02575 [Marmoricola sp. Leaf446]
MNAPLPRRPDHVFVAPSLLRVVVKLLLVLSAAGLGVAVWRLWREQPTWLVAVAVGLAVVLVLCWVTLMARVPQRITITGPMVHIHRGAEVHRFDLEDPGVDLLVRDGSVAFGHYRDNWVIVHARDVDWRPFMDVVMNYQNRADSNAEARDERFKR